MMRDSTIQTNLPKWPFYFGDLFLLSTAVLLALQADGPLTPWQFFWCFTCVAFGACLFVVPFVIEFRAYVGLNHTRLSQVSRDYMQRMESYVIELQEIRDTSIKQYELYSQSLNKIESLLKHFDLRLSQITQAQKSIEESADHIHSAAQNANQNFSAGHQRLLENIQSQLWALTNQLHATTAIPHAHEPANHEHVSADLSSNFTNTHEVDDLLEDLNVGESLTSVPFAVSSPEHSEVSEGESFVASTISGDEAYFQNHDFQNYTQSNQDSELTALQAESEHHFNIETLAPSETEQPEHKSDLLNITYDTISTDQLDGVHTLSELPDFQNTQTPSGAHDPISFVEKDSVLETAETEKQLDAILQNAHEDLLTLDPLQTVAPKAHKLPEVLHPSTEIHQQIQKPVSIDDLILEAVSPLTHASEVSGAHSSNAKETTLIAHVMTGIGKKPYIRGEGEGLSWDTGVPMEFIETGKWQWKVDLKEPVTCCIYKNDELPAVDAPVTIQPGMHLEVSPKFA
jgi:hypothetical protein